MTLRALMAAHMPVLLSTEHFGQVVTVTPKGITQPATFTLSVVMGDQAESYNPDGSVAVAAKDQALMVFQRSAWLAAIGPLTSPVTTRDAARGDTILVPAGLPYAGTWVINEVTNDEGDANNAQLVRPDRLHLGAAGAVELQ